MLSKLGGSTMLFLIIMPLLFISVVKYLFKSKAPKSLRLKHVVVTGGSSGIGLSVAIASAQRGAHVTILARNKDRLNLAMEQIKAVVVNSDQKISQFSCDTADKSSISSVFEQIEQIHPIYMLVNCAGIAICGTVEDITEQDIRTMINSNFLGTLYSIQAVVPNLKKRKEGVVVLTASQVSLMGIYGYSVYSGCKFALRGLAESICMELKPYNVSVTLALPADTDTPGYAQENKTKPKETKLISDTAGVYQPEVVAKKLLDDALGKKFFSSLGFESFILTTLCVGMSPFSSLLEVLYQSVLLGPLRLIAAYYNISFDSIIKKCYLEKTKSK